MNPFRQFQQEFRAARYLKQADALEMRGTLWLTQAELWRHEPPADNEAMEARVALIQKAHDRGEHHGLLRVVCVQCNCPDVDEGCRGEGRGKGGLCPCLSCTPIHVAQGTEASNDGIV